MPFEYIIISEKRRITNIEGGYGGGGGVVRSNVRKVSNDPKKGLRLYSSSILTKLKAALEKVTSF